MNKLALGCAVGSIIVAAVACGSDSKDAPPASSCVAVTQELMEYITQGAQGDQPITPQAGKAIKANDSTFVVVMRFAGPSEGRENVGVWTSSSLEDAGSTVTSVDSNAREYTRWPQKSDATGEPITENDAVVTDAKACLAQ